MPNEIVRQDIQRLLRPLGLFGRIVRRLFETFEQPFEVFFVIMMHGGQNLLFMSF